MNLTCAYSSTEQAPAGKLCGNLISATGKFLGQIRKTNDDEFTVYGWTGIVGKYSEKAFVAAASERLTARKSIRQFTFSAA